ncbi:hypothetical protein [Halodesulfovibrio aestuarii]|uniref:Uncharacterized protein n=1 Tax=Halodesulfovibrio aestuarii TaxID=126333 RepID=A0ABV4JNL7_9BACT
MTNYAAIKPVDAGQKMQSLIDMNEQPVILAIGNDHKLRVIYQPTDSQAPWKTETIFDGSVRNFAIFQSVEKQQIRIAVIADDDNAQTMFYSDILANNFAQIHKEGPLNWNSQELSNDIGDIDSIKIDLENALLTTQGELAFYYGFPLGDTPKRYLLPGNGSKILDIQIGCYLEEQGTFLLYDSNGNSVLIFTPLGTQPGERNQRYSLQGYVNSIALRRDEKGMDEVICAGEALTLHETHRSHEELIAPQKNITLSAPSVSYDEAGVTIFVRQESNVGETKLLYLTNRYLDGETNDFVEQWTSDIPIIDDVKQYTSVKGTQDNNHLVIANSHDDLIHFFFDPVSTMWRTQDVCIEGPDGILEFDSYSTTMCLEDNSDNAAGYLANQDCFISASGNVKAEVNGVSLQLGPHQPKLTKTDLTGSVSVIVPTVGLDTPLIQISRNDNQVNDVIDPAQLAMQRLALIKNADDFKNVRTHDDLPLWTNDNRPSNSNLDQAALIFGQLVKNRHEMFQEQRAKITGVNANGDYLQDDTWGARFEDNGNITFLESEAAKDEIDPEKGGGFKPFKWIGHAISTVFKGLKSLFQKIRSFVVKIRNKVITFVIRIGNKVLNYVIKTIEQFFPFMTYVFDAINLVFRKVMGFIGAVLGLDDIWATHKVIAQTTRNGTQAQIDYFEKQGQKWENYIKINSQALIDKMDKAASEQDPGDSGQSAFERILNTVSNPLINFAFYHLQHSGAMKILHKIGVRDLPQISDYLERQEKNMTKMKGIIDKEVKAVTHAVSHPFQFKKNLIAIIKPLAESILKIAQGLLTDMASTIVNALKHAQKMLDTELHLPFFSAFYKFLGRTYDSDKDWDGSITFVDLTSFIIAIPTSITYRIFTLGKKLKNKVPKDFGDTQMFETVLKPANVSDLNLTTRASAQMFAASNDGVGGNDIDKVIHCYSAFGGIFAGFGGAMKSLVIAFKKNSVPLKVNFILSLIISGLTLPVSGYNAEGKNAQAAYGFDVFPIN